MIWPEDKIEPDYPDPVMECPHCGAELYEGDKIYDIKERGKTIAIVCEHCLEDYVHFLEDYE